MPKNKTILICDDDGPLRETVAEALMDLGHTVHQTKDGLEAFKYLEALTPDLVISDVNMPMMDGFMLLEKMREKNCSFPVILVTGEAHLEHYRRGYSLGHFDFIAKPIHLSKLLSAVEKALSFGKQTYVDSELQEKLKALPKKKVS